MDARRPTRLRVLRALAAFAVPAWVLLLVLIARAGISAYGAVLAVGIGVVWLGFATSGRRRPGLTRAGLAFIVVVVAVRALAVGTGPVRAVHMHHGQQRTAWLGRIVDERDPAVLAAAFLELMGALPAADRTAMTRTLSDGYERLAADAGFVPTVVPAALLAGDADDFDMIAIEVAAPRGVVVFLHGTGGGFTLPCWQVAQAARVAQLSTWCPTTSPDALWSTGAGRAIAERAVAAARDQVPGGVVVGVGLSAGGIGLTALGDDLHVDGAIAISGVAADVAPAQHPTLLLHGTHDAMASIAAARALVRADRAGHTELRAYDANHFLLLQHHDAVTTAVAERLALLLVPTL